jgi:hypothetical protein
LGATGAGRTRWVLSTESRGASAFSLAMRVAPFLQGDALTARHAANARASLVAFLAHRDVSRIRPCVRLPVEVGRCAGATSGVNRWGKCRSALLQGRGRTLWGVAQFELWRGLWGKAYSVSILQLQALGVAGDIPR